MKYRKILLAYNGTKEGKRALLECADLWLPAGRDAPAGGRGHAALLCSLTEGFVAEELLEEEKKRTQTVLDEGIKAARPRVQRHRAPGRGRAGRGNLHRLGRNDRRRPDRRRPQPEHIVRRALVEGFGGRVAAGLRPCSIFIGMSEREKVRPG